MQAAIPAQDSSVTPVAAARRLSLVLYTLYALSFFSAGLTGLVAILINHIKYSDARKTLYGSHFRWQMRTFWFTVLWWTVVLVALFLMRSGSGYGVGTAYSAGSFGAGIGGFIVWAVAIAAMIVNPLWVIYRLIRGSLACIDGRRMPV
jgi:uncharacterized membrane protein